jgi:hypothetical protein
VRATVVGRVQRVGMAPCRALTGVELHPRRARRGALQLGGGCEGVAGQPRDEARPRAPAAAAVGRAPNLEAAGQPAIVGSGEADRLWWRRRRQGRPGPAAVAGVHQRGRRRPPLAGKVGTGHTPALGGTGEVDAPQRAHAGLAELAPVPAAIHGAEQDAVTDRPTRRRADEVDGVQVLRAPPEADPGPPAVAGGQDGALAGRIGRCGAADGLDRLQGPDGAQGEPRRRLRLGRGIGMLPGTAWRCGIAAQSGGRRGCRDPAVGRGGPVAGGAGDEGTGDGRGGGEHHGDGDTDWSHGDLPPKKRDPSWDQGKRGPGRSRHGDGPASPTVRNGLGPVAITTRNEHDDAPEARGPVQSSGVAAGGWTVSAGWGLRQGR